MSNSDEPTEGRGREGVIRREGVLKGAASWGVSAVGLTSMRGTWVVRVEGPRMLSIHVETLGGRGKGEECQHTTPTGGGV